MAGPTPASDPAPRSLHTILDPHWPAASRMSHPESAARRRDRQIQRNTIAEQSLGSRASRSRFTAHPTRHTAIEVANLLSVRHYAGPCHLFAVTLRRSRPTPHERRGCSSGQCGLARPRPNGCGNSPPWLTSLERIN